MQRVIATLGLAAVFATSCACMAEDDETVDLRPKWIPRETTYVEFTWDNNDKYEGSDHPPGGTKTRTVITYGFLHTVKHLTGAGDAVIHLTLDRAAIAVYGEGVNLKYDTDASDETKGLADYGKRLQAALGRSFALAVSKGGILTGVSGAEKIADAVAPQEGDAHESVAAQMFMLLTRPVQYNIWQQYYGSFACEPVPPGAKWTRVLPATRFFPSLTINYQLQSLEASGDRRSAIVAYSAHLDAETKGRDVGGGVKTKSGPFNQAGSVSIDLADGRITNGAETVVHEVQSERMCSLGGPLWLVHVTSSAKHRLVVLTLPERKAKKQP